MKNKASASNLAYYFISNLTQPNIDNVNGLIVDTDKKWV